MARNQPPPRRMVHSVMSQMRDRVDRELKGEWHNLIQCPDITHSTGSGIFYVKKEAESIVYEQMTGQG